MVGLDSRLCAYIPPRALPGRNAAHPFVDYLVTGGGFFQENPAEKRGFQLRQPPGINAQPSGVSLREGKTEQEVLDLKPLADLDAKWAANNPQLATNHTRNVYNSFKRF